MNILVTGAAGFIGHALAIRLCERGDTVLGIDSLNDYYDPKRKLANLEKSRNFDSFQFTHGSLLDFNLLRDLFRGEEPYAVLHLAARAGVRPSLRDPKLYEETNGCGTLNIGHCYHIGW